MGIVGMRTAFHEQLDLLTVTLSGMCELAGLAMERATRALLQADLALAEEVVSDHTRLLRMHAQLEDAAFKLLALQAPVAGDLRSVVATIQSVADADEWAGWRFMSPRSPGAVTPTMHYPKR